MLSEAENDDRLITCRIEGSAYAGKEDISRYLKYKKVFDHPEMLNAVTASLNVFVVLSIRIDFSRKSFVCIP